MMLYHQWLTQREVLLQKKENDTERKRNREREGKEGKKEGKKEGRKEEKKESSYIKTNYFFHRELMSKFLGIYTNLYIYLFYSLNKTQEKK